MSPYQKTQNTINNVYFKNLIQKVYAQKTAVLFVGPPKSGTTWLNFQLWEHGKGITNPPTKDTELLQAFVSDDYDAYKNVIKNFTRKIQSRIVSLHQSKNTTNLSTYGTILPPLTDILLSAEKDNLYSFFLSPMMLANASDDPQSFVYVDASLSSLPIHSLTRIRKIFDMIGFKVINIVIIARDPIERFVSHIIHLLKYGDALDEKNVSFFFQLHLNYLKSIPSNYSSAGCTHGNWVAKNYPANSLPNWFWSKSETIQNRSIFDDVFSNSLLDSISEKYSKVFGYENVYLFNYKDLFFKNKLEVMLNKIKLNSNGVKKFDFEKKIGHGGYKFTPPEIYLKLLSKLLKNQYSFIKKESFS